MTEGRRSAQERAAAVAGLRLRALALLEALARRVPDSPLLLVALGPLLRALAAASRPGGSPPLAERLQGLLVQRLCKSRCGACAVSRTGLVSCG